MTVTQKLNKAGPRKLLALDGGGIRGIITLEILEVIEQLLRSALGANEDFVLADYFDYIAGTSTGAITATALSLGLPVHWMRSITSPTCAASVRQSRARSALSISRGSWVEARSPPAKSFALHAHRSRDESFNTRAAWSSQPKAVRIAGHPPDA
jgi:predicted acylesterase/phospholipase RssA